MLRRLISFSITYRLVVLLVAAVLLVGGVVALRNAPWDVFPDFAPPQTVVQTEAPGLSAEEVERLVTGPVEAAIHGASRLKTVRSSSIPGLSVVTAIFEDGTPILTVRQLVGERLGEVASRLPAGVEPPRMAPLAAATSRLLMVGLTSGRAPATELRTLADWTFRPRLQGVPGVASVEVFGGEVKQYQVLVTPERLKRFGVTLDQIIEAARNATCFSGAGFVETPNQRLPIRQRSRFESAADLAAAPVSLQGGVPVTLGQVAEVREGAADKVGDGVVNGRPGVLMVIHKQPSFNTLSVTDEVQRAIDELKVVIPEGVELNRDLFRQATFIERAIGNLNMAILLGCVPVALVLIAFLARWRTVFISLTVIPLSLLGAVLVLRLLGASLNAMTLGGLAIALGEVVDDAIVDVENVVRRLRENRLRPQPAPMHQIVLSASLEVRSAVVYATFMVIAVFLPVFSMGGLAGIFFRPLGAAYVGAILLSLVMALTVTPALCTILLGGAVVETMHDPCTVRGCKAVYRRLLPLFLRRRGFTLAVAGGLLLAAAASVPFFGEAFLPDFRESNFTIFMAGKPDTSLAESVRAGCRLAEDLQKIPGVSSTAEQIGRATLSEDTWGPNVDEVYVVLGEDVDYGEILKKVETLLGAVPGYVLQTKQFLRERIDEVLTGTRADIVIRVVGQDLQVLRSQAERIAAAIGDVRGVEDLGIEQQVRVPQVEILLRPEDAARYGLTVGEVNREVQTLLQGSSLGQVYEGRAVVDVVVRAHPSVRSSPQLLGELLLDSPLGASVPLKAVAGISIVDAPNIINHEDGSRYIQVTCNADERDVAGVVKDIQARIEDKVEPIPSGYYIGYRGEYQARAEAARRIYLLGAVSMVGIFILLYLDFQSVRLALLVLLSVPLAGIGCVAAAHLAGGVLSIGSLVGAVTVFGVAVRNGILLVNHYEHLERFEGMAMGPDLILRGSIERLSPILMTAGVTMLALLPLVLRGDLPGHEIERPMAIVIIGGLLSSTFLTLFILPVLYGWTRGRGEQQEAPSSTGEIDRSGA